MIGFMPEFYPDELVYSLLARYYQRSGYLAYIHAARDLYAVPSIRPDMYFINPMRDEAWELITRETGTDAVILEHTMVPAYARFLPVEARQETLQQMSRMEGRPYMMLKVTHRRQDRTRYLRYCPECAERDRELYGEAYWHRSAQIQGIDVCPEHGCYLCDSELVVSANTPPMLVTAEELIPQASGVVKCENEMQNRLAEYVLELFNSELEVDNPVTVGEFLHSRLHGTKYVSLRGEQRNITLLQRDFANFYETLPGNTFTRKQQSEDRFDTISGTNGLLGAADGAFLLTKAKRTANDAMLDIAGRDQQDQRLHLVRNTKTLLWEMESAETELWEEEPDPLLEEVARVALHSEQKKQKPIRLNWFLPAAHCLGIGPAPAQ